MVSQPPAPPIGNSGAEAVNTEPEALQAPRRLERDARRLQLIAAATKVFARHGYAAVDVATIVAEARVTRGTFYLYFPTKRDVFLAAIDQYLELIRASASARATRTSAGAAHPAWAGLRRVTALSSWSSRLGIGGIARRLGCRSRGHRAPTAGGRCGQSRPGGNLRSACRCRSSASVRHAFGGDGRGRTITRGASARNPATRPS